MNTKTKEGRDRLAAQQNQQKLVVDKHAWITCLNCEYWKDEQCSLFRAVPPGSVIVHGCEEHVERIPF